MTSSSSTNAAATRVRYYAADEVEALVRSLDRDEDAHVFAEDVLVTYPHLADEYTRVCPQRCDLVTAARKAREGVYSYSPTLAELRADVTLMVNNCIRYNGSEHALAHTARQFARFASDRIDAFLLQKTGGRRVSSLRLRSGTAATTGTTAAAAAVKMPTAKEMLDLVSALVRREDGDAFVVDVAAAYPELREAYAAVCPRTMNLARMRERAAQGYYLHTNEHDDNNDNNSDNDKATPQPPLSARLFGDSVASSLRRMRDDVELIVHNCIRFNIKLDVWVKRALSFERFAQRKLDDFVLRHAPHLRGTPLGVDVYVRDTMNEVQRLQQQLAQHEQQAAVAPPQEQQQQQQQEQHEQPQAQQQQHTTDERQATMRAVDGVAAASTTATTMSSSSNTTDDAHRSADDTNSRRDVPTSTAASRKRTHAVAMSLSTPAAAAAAAAAASVTSPRDTVAVVADALVSVSATPLQPALPIPATLRSRLVADHVRRDQLALRCIDAEAVPVAELLPPVLPTATRATTTLSARNNDNDDDNDNDDNDDDNDDDHHAAALVLSRAFSVDAVLCAFVQSVRRFFARQRSRSDFDDTFRHSVQDEQVYYDLVSLLRVQLNRLLLPLLLYTREAADAHGCVATATLHRPTPSNDNNDDDKRHNNNNSDDNKNDSTLCAVVEWTTRVHYCYLVRLLVQLPQIASLCCASPSSSTTTTTATAHTAAKAQQQQQQTPREGGYVLRISKDALVVLRNVTRITAELLRFVADYEARLLTRAGLLTATATTTTAATSDDAPPTRVTADADDEQVDDKHDDDNDDGNGNDDDETTTDSRTAA